MGTKQNITTPGQGSGVVTGKTVDHVVIQEDLDNNPELVSEGVKVGDTIKLPAESDVNEVVPEWVNLLLASNNSVIESNEAVLASNKLVIEGIDDFKQSAVDYVQKMAVGFNSSLPANVSLPETKQFSEVDFDEDAEYIVLPGKSFQDADTHVTYSEGERVTHLGEFRLKNLIAKGLVEEE